MISCWLIIMNQWSGSNSINMYVLVNISECYWHQRARSTRQDYILLDTRTCSDTWWWRNWNVIDTHTLILIQVLSADFIKYVHDIHILESYNVKNTTKQSLILMTRTQHFTVQNV